MVGGGVPRLVVSKLLNHVESGVTAVYDRHSYDPEKRAALDYWGARLEQLVSEERPAKVLGICAVRTGHRYTGHIEGTCPRSPLWSTATPRS